ncbi:hypothetical protein ACP70R_039474 [Stipagrostis hirtigluma subsp. patula]
MLELKLVKDSLFLKFLEAILDVVDVASVDCSSTGLKLQAVDTEHVVVITLLFPAEEFEHYHCDDDYSMGIAIDDMVKAIRCADKDDTITMKIGDENINTITLIFESPEENDTTAFDLRLVDASSQRFLIPDWKVLDSEYQAFVEMPSAKFMRVCKYLTNTGGGDGRISVTDKGLKFFASGESGHMIKYIQPDEATATVVTMQAPVSMTLDLKYMNCFAKASTLFNQVKICLSTTQPLMVECKIGQMGYIRYFVAPKIKPEIEEEEIKKRKRSKMNDDDEGSAEEKEGSKEIKGSGEEKEESKEIKGSREDKEGIKESEDERIKERGREIEEKKEGIQKESKY